MHKIKPYKKAGLVHLKSLSPTLTRCFHPILATISLHMGWIRTVNLDQAPRWILHSSFNTIYI